METKPGLESNAADTEVVARTGRRTLALGILIFVPSAVLFAWALFTVLTSRDEPDAMALGALALVPIYVALRLVRGGLALRAVANADPSGVPQLLRGLHELDNAMWPLLVLGSIVVLGLVANILFPDHPNGRSRAYLAAMRSDLDNLAGQQMAFFNRDQDGDGLADASYTSDTAALTLRPTNGVVLRIAEATDSGWAATTTHLRWSPDKGCAVYVGRVRVVPHTAGGERPSSPREIVCDGM